MIQKLLNEVILEEDKKKREEAKNRGIEHWRSSGLGTCMRGRFLDRLLSGSGIKPQHDARTLGVFEVGNQIETWMMENLKKQKEYQVVQQVELFDPELNLSGHLDAVLYKEDAKHNCTEPHIVECKSKQSKSFWYMDKKKEGAMIHHKMQLHSYLYMLNKYGGKSPDMNFSAKPFNDQLTKGSIVYVSKDDMAMLEYVVYLDDPELEKMWKYEINTLNDAWNKQIAPPAPEKGSWQEKYCQFCQVGLCSKLDDEMVKELFKENPPKESEPITGTTITGITITSTRGTGIMYMSPLVSSSSMTTSGYSSVLETKPIGKSPRFSVGDRVVVIREAGPVKIGMVGTLVHSVETLWYAVEFDENIGGHNCNGKAKEGYGYYLLEQYLVLQPF